MKLIAIIILVIIILSAFYFFVIRVTPKEIDDDSGALPSDLTPYIQALFDDIKSLDESTDAVIAVIQSCITNIDNSFNGISRYVSPDIPKKVANELKSKLTKIIEVVNDFKIEIFGAMNKVARWNEKTDENDILNARPEILSLAADIAEPMEKIILSPGFFSGFKDAWDEAYYNAPTGKCNGSTKCKYGASCDFSRGKCPRPLPSSIIDALAELNKALGVLNVNGDVISSPWFSDAKEVSASYNRLYERIIGL